MEKSVFNYVLLIILLSICGCSTQVENDKENVSNAPEIITSHSESPTPSESLKPTDVAEPIQNEYTYEVRGPFAR